MKIHPLGISLLFFLIPISGMAWNPDESCLKPPKDPVQAQMAAGDLFSKAEADYKSSRPLDALKGFLCSHRIMPHENTLFNIDQIAKLGEHRDESIKILKDFVNHVEGKNKTEPIEEIIADLENKLNEKNATETAPEEPRSPDGATEEIPPDETPQADEEAASKKPLKIAGITMLAVGGAALVTGSIFQGLAASSQSKAEGLDDYSKFQQEKDRLGKLQIGAITGFVSGGIFSGVGMVFYLLARKQESLGPANISLLPSYRGFTLVGRF